MRLVLLLIGALVLVAGAGCRRPQGTDPAALMRQAQARNLPVTTAQDLFGRHASLEEWQTAFSGNPDDLELFEAYAFKQLLMGKADSTVREALDRCISIRVEDPYLRFLRAYRVELEILGTRQDQETRLQQSAVHIRDELAKAQELQPDNAFYAYQEASYWFAAGDPATGAAALRRGNAARHYRHPYGAPFPRELASLTDLVPALGGSLGLYFQTSPRTLTVTFYNALRQTGQQHAADLGVIVPVLEAAARQLTMEPFDTLSFSNALGLNKTLWEQAKQRGYGPADKVIAALGPLEELNKKETGAIAAIGRQLTARSAEAQLEYGATMLARTLDFERAVARPREVLFKAIKQALPEDPGPPATPAP